MTNIRAKGFESTAQLEEYMLELDDARNSEKYDQSSSEEAGQAAQREIVALRAEVDALNAKLRIIRAQTQDVATPAGESEVTPWLRIATTVATTFVLGRLVQRLRLGAPGTAAVPMIAAQLDRRFW